MKQLTRVFAFAVLTLAVSSLALGQAQSKKMVAKNAVDTSTPNIVSQRTADADVAKAVIEMTKAEWASEIRDPSNLAEQTKDMADDYTEFRPEYPTRLEGKNQYVRINTAGANANPKPISSEMFNPKVQVYNGDVAILSYHYVGIDKDNNGKTENTRVKVTRVYVKRDGKWMLVHKNVGSDPLPK